MKKIGSYFLSACLLTIYSCNSDSVKQTSADSTDVSAAECFTAIQGTDTAHLTVRSAANGKYSGDLHINNSETPDNTGTFTAEMKGDTLFADYTFKTGEDKATYRNPLAFLKDSSGYVLGVGEIESYLGRSYFKKGVPIRFDNSKFRFQASNCN